MVSTWGFLHGLRKDCTYLGIDLFHPPRLAEAMNLCKEKGINFKFIAQNDMLIDVGILEEVDMIFIDSLHTYCHLTFELEKFSHLSRKYLTFHDSSGPWENTDDSEYHGDYSEYPSWYDRTKRGCWPAIQDFLERRKTEWKLKERRLNNNGLTILERIK